MRNNFSYIVAFFVLTIVLLGPSCRKERFLNSGGELRYSVDTLKFDTVFTAQGSFTNSFRIYNPQSQAIKISSIRLGNGSNSYFSLNVDGKKGEIISDIEIAPNDSVFVFATVNIDPNNDNIPFVVEDKVIATMNGNTYELPLQAYGQNAYYIEDSFLQTQTWLTDKPYIVLNSAIVDSLQTLTIPAGCRVYMHANSNLYVKGTLIVNGTKTDSVVFQGDRLDRAYFGYEGYPGEWGGIVFLGSSHNNILDYAVLRNCGNGGGGSTLPAALYVTYNETEKADVTLKHVTIENSIGYGLLCFDAVVHAENCLFHNTGAQALAIFQGGSYEFLNCDFINYGTNKVSHIDNPAVAILNYLKKSETEYIVGPLLATKFTNCVIWGSLDNELVMDKLDAASYELTLENCMLKKNTTEDPIPGYVQQGDNKLNEDPLFEDYGAGNYRPKAGSPLIDNGKAVNFISPTDLDDEQWASPFDIGCYQY